MEPECGTRGADEVPGRGQILSESIVCIAETVFEHTTGPNFDVAGASRSLSTRRMLRVVIHRVDEDGIGRACTVHRSCQRNGSIASFG